MKSGVIEIVLKITIALLPSILLYKSHVIVCPLSSVFDHVVSFFVQECKLCELQPIPHRPEPNWVNLGNVNVLLVLSVFHLLHFA